jgi:hypothetical protein
MAQSNQIKSFIRVDAQGRDIPSTNVLRIKKPVTGKWRELESAYECCSPSVLLTATPSGLNSETYIIAILCDGDQIIEISAIAEGVAVTIEDVVALLNEQVGYLGTWSVASNGTDIELRLKYSIAESICDVAELTLTVTSD